LAEAAASAEAGAAAAEDDGSDRLALALVAAAPTLSGMEAPAVLAAVPLGFVAAAGALPNCVAATSAMATPATAAPTMAATSTTRPFGRGATPDGWCVTLKGDANEGCDPDPTEAGPNDGCDPDPNDGCDPDPNDGCEAAGTARPGWANAALG
jgi:hypothetical protein